MDSLVFDTSALLNFGHRGELTVLLKRLAGECRIVTTSAAQAELTDPKRKKYYAEFLREHFTVQDAAGTPFDLATLSRLSRAIDPGEMTILMLAAEIKGTAVLDDKAARREAKILGLKLPGTVALLHRGLQRTWLTDSECLARVAQLCNTGFAIPRPAAGQTFADYFAKLE